ncbi:hypothetical protein VKT23_013002 [Stygiomarasmius scandens]|uniref:Uncharacterized protein n=1 Tax=Marasmiellus scandens TaxID=2682957 RepID=A0ABR1J7K6_9AGAR
MNIGEGPSGATTQDSSTTSKPSPPAAFLEMLKELKAFWRFRSRNHKSSPDGENTKGTVMATTSTIVTDSSVSFVEGDQNHDTINDHREIIESYNTHNTKTDNRHFEKNHVHGNNTTVNTGDRNVIGVKLQTSVQRFIVNGGDSNHQEVVSFKAGKMGFNLRTSDKGIRSGASMSVSYSSGQMAVTKNLSIDPRKVGEVLRKITKNESSLGPSE